MTMNRFFTIYINIATICFLLIGIEVAGHIGFYLIKGYPVWEYRVFYGNAPNETLIAWAHGEHETLFEHHPYLVGSLKANARLEDRVNITITDTKTRWTGAQGGDSRQIKIAILGGSTTFGTGVSDEDSWPALLQEQLGKDYYVINFGTPGYSTAEAIIQMALIIPESQPDIVIFYEGWNDIRLYHDPNFSADYASHGLMQMTNLRVPITNELNNSFFQKFERVSSIFRFSRWVSEKISPVGGSWKELGMTSSDARVDRVYQRNLETLRVLTDRIGAHAIFVPQIINYDYHIDEERKKYSSIWTPRINNGAMPALMDRFNGLMTNACDGDTKGRCSVATQVEDVNWRAGEKDWAFVDDGHFSREGGEVFADVLVQIIKKVTSSD